MASAPRITEFGTSGNDHAAGWCSKIIGLQTPPKMDAVAKAPSTRISLPPLSRVQDSVILEVPEGGAQRACRRAISVLGWRILEDSERRMVIKEVMSSGVSFTWPAKIEILIHEQGQACRLELNGSITGLGPVQKNHLKGQMGALRNNIQLALEQRPAPSGETDSGALASELERLLALREKGALSDEEFAQAKARLLKA